MFADELTPSIELPLKFVYTKGSITTLRRSLLSPAGLSSISFIHPSTLRALKEVDDPRDVAIFLLTSLKLSQWLMSTLIPNFHRILFTTESKMETFTTILRNFIFRGNFENSECLNSVSSQPSITVC